MAHLDSDSEAVRSKLAALLASGLPTDWKDRADTDAKIQSLTARLRQLASDDYRAKLTIAGYLDKPYRPPGGSDVEEACRTCMYFERHREHCGLPDLDLPVRPEWSCVLWRI